MSAPWRGSAPRSSRRQQPRSPVAVKNHRPHAVSNWQRKAAVTKCLKPALLPICSSTSGISAQQSTTAWAWCLSAIRRSTPGSRSRVCGSRLGKVQPCGNFHARTAQNWLQLPIQWLLHQEVHTKHLHRLQSGVVVSAMDLRACFAQERSADVEVQA